MNPCPNNSAPEIAMPQPMVPYNCVNVIWKNKLNKEIKTYIIDLNII